LGNKTKRKKKVVGWDCSLKMGEELYNKENEEIREE
jgi:hypothetical protein